MSGQRGQVLVLVSLLLAVIAGFLGLVIDGGGVAAEQQLVRSAADGAALAGGYAVFRQGSTLAAASAAAQQVVVADGLPGGDLAMAYLDAGGAVTATPSLVRTVRATVNDARRTVFLGLLGIASTQISAVAQVAGAAGTTAPCALCAMSASATGVSVGDSGQLTVTGAPVIVNSTANPNVSVGSGAVLSGPSIVEVGNQENNNGTISPTAVSGSPVADPHAGVAAPSVSGSAVSYTAPAGSASISPGVYSMIRVNAGSSLTLQPGVYVLTGPLLGLGGSISGSGVMLYLACPSYPTACASGASGAAIGTFGGSLTLGPPTSGTYAGMTVFADRNNQATSGFGGTAVTVTGTWYTLKMPVVQASSGDVLHFGEMDVASISVASSTQFTIAYVPSQSYGGGSGSGPLSLSL